MKVVFTQFMKNNSSNELKILEKIDNIHMLFCDKEFGFVWNMTEQEKEDAKKEYTKQFEKAIDYAVKNNCDMLIMDEFMSCFELQFVDNNKALEFLRNKPEKLEVVLTGRNPSDELCELADYITEMKKIKHPFDNGVNARNGIEI